MKNIILVTLFILIAIGGAGFAIARKHSYSDKPRVTLQVNGMVCAACVVSVQKSLQMVPGVDKVRVSPARSLAQITLNDSSVSSQRLIDAVKAAGFEALNYSQ